LNRGGIRVENLARRLGRTGKQFQRQINALAAGRHFRIQRLVAAFLDRSQDLIAPDNPGEIVGLRERAMFRGNAVGLLQMDNGGVTAQRL